MKEQFEIEKKAWPLSESEYQRVLEWLSENEELIKEKNMISFYFRDPSYLRIRQHNGLYKVIRKSNSRFECARKEKHELVLTEEQVGDYVKENITKGFQYCMFFEYNRLIFRTSDDLKIVLDNRTHLGNLVEVEALTEDEHKIPDLIRKVNQTFRKLNLSPVDEEEYRKHFNRLYDVYKKPVTEYFNVS